jgi:hypothetical protein
VTHENLSQDSVLAGIRTGSSQGICQKHCRFKPICSLADISIIIGLIFEKDKCLIYVTLTNYQLFRYALNGSYMLQCDVRKVMFRVAAVSDICIR